MLVIECIFILKIVKQATIGNRSRSARPFSEKTIEYSALNSVACHNKCSNKENVVVRLLVYVLVLQKKPRMPMLTMQFVITVATDKKEESKEAF